jgi:hypothetical protein
MPWGRVDDDFYDHPKVTAMPADVRNAACGLYWRAISYCNRYLTDGRLTEAALAKLDACSPEIEALLAVGLFDQPKANGKQSASLVLRVHDFLTRNKSRRQVLAERIQKIEAGRLGGVKSGEKRRAGSSSEAHAKSKQSASESAAVAKQGASSTHDNLEAERKQSASSARSKTEAPGVELPSRPIKRDESTTPKAVPARKPEESFDSKAPRLTKAALEAWATFEAQAWQPFKAAWLARGLLLPPFGDADDDEGTSQRARLWAIADDQPEALAQWIKEAPGKSAHQVIAYVFAQRAKLAAEVGAEEADQLRDGSPEIDRRALQKLGEMLPKAKADAAEAEEWIGGGDS